MPTLGQRATPAPDLQYLILPPYEIPELIVIGGVVVENRGSAPANNVKVALEYDETDATRIHYLHVVSEVDYILRGGGESHTFATLRVRKLDAGKRLVIYFSGSHPIQPRVIVTNYEGTA